MFDADMDFCFCQVHAAKAVLSHDSVESTAAFCKQASAADACNMPFAYLTWLVLPVVQNIQTSSSCHAPAC
eukprot:114261-Rhodomonas_salina.2